MNRRTGLVALTLLALVAVAHGQALGFGFVMDDWPQIADSARRGHIGLADIFAKGVWGSSVPGMMSDNYRPLFSLWLEVVARLFGPSAPAYHAGALLLHAANVLLLWRLTGKWLAPLPAAFAAALFAVHPALVQPVAWISGATDLLMGLFVLLALHAYGRWRANGTGGWFAAAAAAYLAAVLSKEVALVLPALLFALDRRAGLNWRRSAPLAALIFAPILWAVLRANALPATGLEGNMAVDLTGLARLADAFAFSVQASVFPAPQFYHLTREAAPLTSWLVLPAVGLWLGVAWAAGWWRAVVPAAWFFLFLAPPMVLAFHAIHAWNFRFLYLPMMGAVWLAGMALERQGWRWPVALVAAGLVASPLLATDWQDDEHFYAMVRRSNPASESGYGGLLMTYRKTGDLRRQDEVLGAAVANVTNQRALRNFLVDYGNVLNQQGRPHDAAAQFRRLAGMPEGRKAGLMGLAVSLWGAGDPEAALAACEEAAELAPGDPRVAALRDRLRRVVANRP